MQGNKEFVLGSPVKSEPLPVLTAMKDTESNNKKKSLTAWGAVFTCSNACIGAGVLAFPNVFANGGLVLTLSLMLIVAVLEKQSLSVLVRESKILGVTDYQGIVGKLYGSGLSIFFSCIIVLYMFGALTAYIIIIGDVLSAVAERHVGENSVYSSHQFCILFMGCCVLLPLSLKRHFHDLQYVSILSMCSLFYLLVATVIRSMQVMWDKSLTDIFSKVHLFPSSFHDVMNAVPVIAFAFVCHLQICEIAIEINPYASFVGRRRSSTEILVDGMYSNALSSLQDETTLLIRSPVTSARRTRKMMSNVMNGALIICGFFYGTMGGVAYIAQPDKWLKISDLLQGYGVTDNLMEVGRVALVLNLMCSYPINLGPARSCIMDLMQRAFDNKLNDNVLATVVTVCLVALSMFTGISVGQLGVVFKIIGGTVGAVLIFSVPGLMLTSKAEERCSKDYINGWILQIFGAALLSCTMVSYFV